MKDFLKTLSEIQDAVVSAVNQIPTLEERGKNIQMGADGTPTMEIDKIAENIVLDYIVRNSVPLNVLSEEIGFVDYGHKDTLVLDPIDGSKNATKGIPIFSISMAIGKKSLQSVYLAYMRNITTGESYWAEKGKGAFKNGKKMKVHNPFLDSLSMMMFLGSDAQPEQYQLAKKTKSFREFGCSSLEMQYVADGRYDGFYYHCLNKKRMIRVIDIAASCLILREAGGEIYDLDGNPLDMPFNLKERQNFIAVQNPNLYHLITGKNLPSKEKKTYLLTVNPESPNVKDVAKRVRDALKGENIVFDKDTQKVLGIKYSKPPANPDVVICVGGDGTILRAAHIFNAPIVGINNGGVGFMADIQLDKLEKGLKLLREGKYAVTERFRLETYLNGKKLESQINETVINTDTVAKIRHFRIFVNDNLATEIRSDGLLISTPVGSTSYSMSLGAPLMDNDVDAFMIVPIAAYRFDSRPFVVPSSQKVSVECVHKDSCLVVVDGQFKHKASCGSVVEISRSKETIRFVNFGKDFYSRVREKLVNRE